MTADIRVTPGGIEAGVPKPLFHYRSKGGGWPYDVTADGQHFVVNESVADSAVVPLTLVMNWNADTKR